MRIKQQDLVNSEPKVPLRIGIHIGEIVRKNDDVFGDGLNIASRITYLKQHPKS